MDAPMRTLLRKEWVGLWNRGGWNNLGLSLLVIVMLGMVGFAGLFPVMATVVAMVLASHLAADSLTYPPGVPPYAFLFTQPVRRRDILTAKLLVGLGALGVFLAAAGALYLATGGGYQMAALQHIAVKLYGSPPPSIIVSMVAGVGCALWGFAADFFVWVRHSAGAASRFPRGLIHVAGPILVVVPLSSREIPLWSIGTDGGRLAPQYVSGWFYVAGALVAAAIALLYLRAAYRAIEAREVTA